MNYKNILWGVLVILAFGGACGGIVDHFMVSGRWFSWSTMAHHEPLIAMALAFGMALIVGKYLGKK